MPNIIVADIAGLLHPYRKRCIAPNAARKPVLVKTGTAREGERRRKKTQETNICILCQRFPAAPSTLKCTGCREKAHIHYKRWQAKNQEERKEYDHTFYAENRETTLAKTARTRRSPAKEQKKQRATIEAHGDDADMIDTTSQDPQTSTASPESDQVLAAQRNESDIEEQEDDTEMMDIAQDMRALSVSPEPEQMMAPQRSQVDIEASLQLIAMSTLGEQQHDTEIVDSVSQGTQTMTSLPEQTTATQDDEADTGPPLRRITISDLLN
ncbi:hypothetical protein F4808DRAFT_465074 [Astrocystis sublimbata]|nr:hypothetical protein F4808DRAFT_465074 [Astrocystis sublimbata]